MAGGGVGDVGVVVVGEFGGDGQLAVGYPVDGGAAVGAGGAVGGRGWEYTVRPVTRRPPEGSSNGSSTAARVVVAAEPVTSVDVTSSDMLAELHAQLQAGDIGLCFAEMKDPVKDKLKRFGLFERFGAGAFHPTVEEAVAACLPQPPEKAAHGEGAAPIMD